jgi:hypothetical protein
MESSVYWAPRNSQRPSVEKNDIKCSLRRCPDVTLLLPRNNFGEPQRGRRPMRRAGRCVRIGGRRVEETGGGGIFWIPPPLVVPLIFPETFSRFGGLRVVLCSYSEWKQSTACLSLLLFAWLPFTEWLAWCPGPSNLLWGRRVSIWIKR